VPPFFWVSFSVSVSRPAELFEALSSPLPVAVSFPADGTETARVSTFFLIVWETIEMAVEQPVTLTFVFSWISAPFWATNSVGICRFWVQRL